MTLQQITAGDIAAWNSLDDIASNFEKRGLKPRPNLGAGFHSHLTDVVLRMAVEPEDAALCGLHSEQGGERATKRLLKAYLDGAVFRS